MKISNAFALVMQPQKLGTKIFNRINYLYQLHIVKKPFFVAHRKWVQDKGDSTLRLAYTLNSGSVVFDIGGYKGDFANALYQQYQCPIYIFEPVSDFYQICEARFSGNTKIKCFNYGLSNTDSEIFISRDDDASSTARQTSGHLKEKIALKDMATTMENLHVHEIDLLKINIEGGEYDVLPRLIETGFIKNIRFLQIQFHDFIPNAVEMREKIRGQLASTHREQWNYPFVWESWVRL
ncbi:FkbM family methyltransferase [Rhodoferax sp. WC2427]|uniref:FkbM family methyltransferase n=1 Tax=Rhodoferax sp. WC2427 TaxID=3234144 RepID=UPI0034660628